MEIQHIKAELLQVNEGQLDGLPSNPRIIKDRRFSQLKKSIKELPQMMELRELIVYPIDGGNYIIIGGNMRYLAGKELGIKEFPCKVLGDEVSLEELQSIIIKDNNNYGTWDTEILANEFDEEIIKDVEVFVSKFEKRENADIDEIEAPVMYPITILSDEDDYNRFMEIQKRTGKSQLQTFKEVLKKYAE